MSRKDKTFNIRMNTELYEELKKVSDEKEYSISLYIRDAIKEKLAREGK